MLSPTSVGENWNVKVRETLSCIKIAVVHNSVRFNSFHSFGNILGKRLGGLVLLSLMNRLLM